MLDGKERIRRFHLRLENCFDNRLEGYSSLSEPDTIALCRPIQAQPGSFLELFHMRAEVRLSCMNMLGRGSKSLVLDNRQQEL